MALDKNQLKTEIQAEFVPLNTQLQNGETITAEDYIGKLSDVFNSYFTSNADVSFSWTAVQTTPVVPSPPPDTVITASGEIVTLNVDLEPAHTVTLSDQLIADFTSATVNITDSGFATAPVSFSTAPTLSNLSIDLSSGGNPITDHDDAILKMCEDIINWVKSLIPTTPVAGTRTSGPTIYTGTGLVTSIA